MLATRWSEACQKNHPLCKPPNPAFRPTRLVQIIDSKLVKLAFPANTPKGDYAALSHCWGQAQTIKLESKNLDEFSKGIQVRDLPESYQEAISMCLKLNLHFIWIDSLCIIQDSKTDWEREAITMKLVYGNAKLNLCAAAAVDSSERSLVSRDASLIGPLEVSAYWNGQGRQSYRLIYSQMFSDNISNCPLGGRAWVIQEWYLSKRSLILARDQLWWHCREELACESFPNGAHAWPFINWKNEAEQMKDDTGQMDAEDPRSKASLSSWFDRVQSYSSTRLTKESDRLMAFSGIAQAFGESHGITDDYLAGLWRCQLPTALCWYAKGSPTSRSLKYKAPSWTWASIDGPFYTRLSYVNLPTCASIERVLLHHVDEKQITGPVKGGAIKLRGHLIGPRVINSDGELSYHDASSPGQNLFSKLHFDETNAEGGPMASYVDDIDPDLCSQGIVDGASRRTMPSFYQRKSCQR
ncbi:hypothetical protein MKZ38_004380 [Zalerion maritima]|uniref:Heterokaryon incompatibility domain-containing protein n=1 Tax=Zalerion maritima TaxID=339359 RepID=A0AAD5RM95_9PEZI|nr:hypothetical protein MKZ38_004380 [Zalerion maritima]